MRGRLGTILAIAALLAAGVALRWPMLTQSLWWDEVLRTRLFLSGDPLDPGSPLHARLWRDVHNPLYNAVMAAWIRLAGDGEVAVRLPSMAMAMGAALLAFAWTRRHVGRFESWVALAAMMAAPVHVWYSTTAKNNAQVMLLAWLTAAAWSRLADATPARAWWRGPTLVAGLVGAAGIWTSWLTLLPMACGAAGAGWVAWRDRGARRVVLRRGAGAIGLALVLALPLIVLKASDSAHVWRGYLRVFDAREAYFLLANYFVSGNALAPGDPLEVDWAAIAGAGVLPILAVGAWRLARSRGGVMVPMQVVGTLVLFAAVSALLWVIHRDTSRAIYQERNAVMLLPGLAVMAAAGVGAVRSRAGRGVLSAAVVGVPLVSSLVMLGPSRGAFTVFWPNPDWRGAACFLSRDAASLPMPGLVEPRLYSWSFPEALWYYTRPLGVADVRRARPFMGESIVGLARADHPPGAREARVFYVLSDAFWWPVSEAELAELSSAFELTATVRLRALTVYRFVSPGVAPGG